MTGERVAQKDLLLIGGGHAHALVLRRLAMTPHPELRITLISPAAFTPYSGMLPGLLAGHYRFEEAHIDLARLCQWAGVRFLADEVKSIDPLAQRVTCRVRGELAYDLVSIDIGSQPELDSVPGAREHAVPVKPVAGLWSRWEALKVTALTPGHGIAVVGGGAGSVELALAIAQYLQAQAPQITLYCGAAQLLEGYSAGARRAVETQLRQMGVHLAVAQRVTRVQEGQLDFASGASAAFDTLIWSTGAAAAPWIADSGLAVDARGFLLIEDTLQSVDCPTVFAAGDIATQHNHPRPKAGVYAVRQGPVLADNLLAYAAGRPLRSHRPQSEFLSLLSLGPKRAVAQRNGMALSGAWVWRWKDRIDRTFMARFSNLPERTMGTAREESARGVSQMPCGGCGAKVSSSSLGEVLETLRQEYGEHAPAALDDAVALETGGPLLQSLDALRALVDDPWRMGRIATQHALSDIYACGANPHSALALVTLPFAGPQLLRRDLQQVLSGALSLLSACGCRLTGGHSMQGPELQIAFAVNGTLGGAAMLQKRGAQPGDGLILTKPLGVGALFAAHMQAMADGRDIENALTMMEQSNACAAAIAREQQAHALTDVTGFGLGGHLCEMLGEGLTAQLSLEVLPVLPGALEAMQTGIFSTLHGPNRDSLAGRFARAASCGAEDLRAELLFDPQTSGGLLLAVPRERVAATVAALVAAGCAGALIGDLRERVADEPQLLFS